MINNTLNQKELENIFFPILRLDTIEEIKESIYKVFHFDKYLPTEQRQFILSSKTTNIKTVYKGYEIEIRGLGDSKNDYHEVSIQFRKKWTFIDLFLTPTKRIKKTINKICEKEIHDFFLREETEAGITPKDGGICKIFHQSDALNPDYKNSLLSPLTLLYKNDFKSILIEFNFMPHCYFRRLEKTYLKKDWLKWFSINTYHYEAINQILSGKKT